MKKRWISAAAVVLCAMLLPRPVLAAESLIPVGRVIGLELQDDSVMVAGFDEKLSKNAKKAGLKVGDEILKVDDTPVDSTEDVRNALQRCTGDVELQFVTAEDYVQVFTGTGDVEIGNAKTASGNIETKTGDIVIPASWKNGNCRIETDTGNIHFQ